MASTFAVTRNHLIFGVCLPFAVLLGYLLADVNDPVSMLVIATAIVGLSFPLLMRWYHPILIAGWNTTAQASFLPGAPQMWACLAILGLFFAVLNRSVNSENKFVHVQSLTLPITAFGAVVVITAALTGGVELQIFGGAMVGGRNYFYVLMAIVGFFALSSRTISPKHAYGFLALFYLPGITSMLSQIAAWVGPSLNFVYLFFPATTQPDLFDYQQSDAFGEMRISGMTTASACFFYWMLARYGIQGVFDLTRPWRLVLFLGGITLGFFGGYRSHLILVTLTFSILFVLERLWRTKVVLIIGVMGVLATGLLLTSADKLPPTVQRGLSFLPIDIDPMIKVHAEASSQWRIELWRQVVDEVPVYFFRGKGYTFSGGDNYMAQHNQMRFGHMAGAEWAAISGDYHNGPLSLLIPFGIYGLLGFMWLIAAGSIYLYKNYQHGLPELKTINAFLFAAFTARAVFFFSIFGAVSSELYFFTGILGLSVALNTQKKSEPLPEGELALQA
jgi:O-Antigen ligase